MTASSLAAAGRSVAIVGIGCRFPGGVTTPGEFWQLLVEGRQAITEIPRDRIDTARYFDPRPATPGRIMSRWGGYLEAIDGFDCSYFGLSPREAERLDPQQRLLLETACEAIDDAGVDRATLEGSRTGVFVGQWLSDFEARLFANPESVDFYMTTGSGRYASSGRLSYLLGLRGPSLTIDTACSSSLAAVHLAAISVRNGESELALAGGVNVILQPHITIAYSQSRMMAPDGRCKFGDARGDGYVRSEGAAVILLKALDRAVADGDRIYAVIRGSAVNNDGRSSGSMGTPSRVGQDELLARACGDAGVEPASIGLVEAHGTGTRAGDPVEIGALGDVLARGRPADRLAWVGSVKTNIGHTEGAAGVAGLVKAALALHRETIPASLNFEQPNPAIPWSEIPLRIPTAAVPWPRGYEPRRAGVSAFGIAGTNAHVVLEESPLEVRPESPAQSARSGPQLLLLSAASPEALVQRARDLQACLRQEVADPERLLSDVCYTAAVRRTHLEYRLAIAASRRDEMCQRLEEFAAGQASESCWQGRGSPGERRRIAFVYPGQGSQWLGMGRDLMGRSPSFRAAVGECDALIREQAGWSVIAELEADATTSRLSDIDVVQPVLFALQVALTRQWRAMGVEPDLVVGHSMGEVAAAWAAGALSLADAVRVICNRSRLMRDARGKGAMALVELTLEDAGAALERFGDRLCVAVSNSLRSTVVAGDPVALDELLAELQGREIFQRRINVDVASHSPQMDPLLEPLRAALAGLVPRNGALPLHSTVEARPLAGGELGVDYWVRNLRSTVRFGSVVRDVLAAGPVSFVELSPHPALLAAIQQEQQAAGVDGPRIPSLLRDTDGEVAFQSALASLHVAGHAVRWDAAFEGPWRPVDLPCYPWQRERHWFEPTAAAGGAAGRAGLLGALVTSSIDADLQLAELQLDLQRVQYLADHKVRGNVVVPAALFVGLACEAGLQLPGRDTIAVEDLRLEEALMLDPEARRLLQVALTAGPPGKRSFRISSRDLARSDAPWTVHARGFIAAGDALGPAPAGAPPSGSDRAASEHYAAAARRGLEYGPAFQGVTALRQDGGVATARIALANGLSTSGSALHPALLDAALQLGVALIDRGSPADTFVPVRVETVTIAGASSTSGWARACRRATAEAESETVVVDIDVFSDESRCVARIGGLVFRRIGAADASGGPSIHRLTWRPQTAPAPGGRSAGSSAGTRLPSGVDRPWLVVADDARLAAAIAAPLRARGQPAVIADVGAMTAPAPDLSAYDAIILAPGAVEAGEPGDASFAGALAACSGVLATIHALTGKDSRPHPRLLVATRGAQAVLAAEAPRLDHAPCWGLMRTLANEHAELRSRVIDLPRAPLAADFERLADELLRGEADQAALRDDQVLLPRLEPAIGAQETLPALRGPRAGRAYRAVATTPGILDGLLCRPVPRRAPEAGEVEIEVAATGLNFLNVLSALGAYPGYADGVGPLGLECAGRVLRVGSGVADLQPGDAVLAIARDCLASHVTVDARLVRRVPAALSLAQAAAVPVAFATAHHALVDLARLQPGERVLIHAAAGGVGLAAIQIARSRGAEIYATAGSPEKRALVASLGARHVMDSRSLAFRDELLAVTGGEGVDVVLNSLAGEFVQAGLDVLRPYGRFLEIGKRDIYQNSRIGLLPFSRSLSYFAIDLDRTIRERPGEIASLLDAVLAGFERGEYDALPLRSVPVSSMTDAFRDMAQGSHTGKLVITHDDPALQLELHRDALADLVSGACVITGGLGGLGLALADWLVERGARRLALLGRSAPDAQQRAAVGRLQARGATVVTLQADAADPLALAEALEAAERDLGPITGAVHVAGLLDDAMMPGQDAARFARAFAPKLDGAWNLHRCLQARPDAVLVLFSSVAALLGLPGQANYAAANAGLDALAHWRTVHGQPTLSIDWGPWADIGLAARSERRGARLESNGLGSMPPTAALDAFGRALAIGAAQLAVMTLDVEAYVGAYPPAARSALLQDLRATGTAPARAAPDQGLRERLRDATPGRPRMDLLREFVKEQVGRVLRQPAARITVDKPFRTLGLDSLMGLELRNRLESGTQLTLPATLVWNYPTVAVLAEELASRLDLPSGGEAASAGGSAAAAVAPQGAGRPELIHGGEAADAELEALLAEVESMTPEEAQRLLSQQD
ncbi:MAG: SDR family NAD(P)-dependent oxidoreductase [Gammaproteobacteria bacterium]|nr:SDR family NAD(P)-dependent oxidoreductase [Gammaproteobacteria bacterium]